MSHSKGNTEAKNRRSHLKCVEIERLFLLFNCVWVFLCVTNGFIQMHLFIRWRWDGKRMRLFMHRHFRKCFMAFSFYSIFFLLDCIYDQWKVKWFNSMRFDSSLPKQKTVFMLLFINFKFISLLFGLWFKTFLQLDQLTERHTYWALKIYSDEESVTCTCEHLTFENYFLSTEWESFEMQEFTFIKKAIISFTKTLLR